MREILFRGKRLSNGEWVEGYLFKSWDECYILWGTRNGVPNMHKVIPETVGQFTGLLDKNGNKIFEGDILSLKDEVGKKGVVTVGFEDGGFILFKGLAWRYIGAFRNIENELEVVGNIHENSELYKENKGESK